ncbi:glycerate kinase [candidate division WOR-3 bacterium]|nr:glycerate kinase [candidate division WOR-3 bacterium]
MKIVIAPNAFKDCLSSIEVANCIEKGLYVGTPETSSGSNRAVKLVKIPLADGGDGTLEVLTFKAGRRYKKKVHGPLWDLVEAEYGILDNGTAIIELALSSGLSLLSPDKRNPINTTTYGTGELIKDALNKGVKKIILGVGGSATCDGGAGILARLGIKFINKQGKSFIPVGKTLKDIKEIDFTSCIKLPKTIVACDVFNPLLGKDGAANVYAPQKGASSEEVKLLEKGLTHFSNLVPEGKKLSQLPGVGASGGAPFGLSLIGAKIVSGAKLMMEMLDFEKKAKDASLIITGEGGINENTKYGKVVYEVMQFGRKHKIPVIAITGNIGKGTQELYKQGLTSIITIGNGPISLKQSIQDASRLLEDAAERLGRMISII